MNYSEILGIFWEIIPFYGFIIILIQVSEMFELTQNDGFIVLKMVIFSCLLVATTWFYAGRICFFDDTKEWILWPPKIHISLVQHIYPIVFAWDSPCFFR